MSKPVVTYTTEAIVNSLVTFLKNSIESLKTGSYSCCRFIMPNSIEGVPPTPGEKDFNVALFVGWSAGYDENDKTSIHYASDPTYCLNAGIKLRNDYDWADFDFLFYPYTPDSSHDPWDTDITLSEDNANLRETAKWLLKEYTAMVEQSLQDDNKIKFAL